MNIKKNIFVAKNHGHSVLMDLYFEESEQKRPVVIFAHGFKGFKDWGHWEILAKHFAQAGYVFVKFNFSHNGTTPEDLLAFGDLEAFGENNYLKELEDLDQVLDKVVELAQTHKTIDLSRVSLIGHSRGGGIGLVKTAMDARIHLMICWASVSRLDYAWQDTAQLAAWKSKGVYYIRNGRTQQDMPLYYQLYETFKEEEELLDVARQVKSIDKPLLILHGTEDPAVPVLAAQQLHRWNPSSELVLIEGANHVFGGKHPYELATLPAHSQELFDESYQFLRKHFK
ncbi:MAG: alpha/beta hydrolase family protein [Saprospiraceae bacterium]